MKKSSASIDLSSMIDRVKAFSSYDQDSSTSHSTDSPLSFKENSKNSDLLITHGLTFNEIKERVELIEHSIKDGLMLNIEDLKKLQRIKGKIQISEELEKAIKAKDDIKEVSLSEKYLSPFLLQHFASDINKTPDSQIQIHSPRKSLRISKDSQKDMKIVASNTAIDKLKEGNDIAFRLSFFNDGYNFQYKVKFKENKFDFVFECVFPSKKQTKINLFPEEIQLAMFDRLVENFPEVLEKLQNAFKINLKQSEIINNNSASLISQYLHLKSLQDDKKDGPCTSVPCHKILLSSTPNQSNNDNFFNQLITKYNLEQKKYHPPKVICNSRWNSSIKLTAIRGETLDI